MPEEVNLELLYEMLRWPEDLDSLWRRLEQARRDAASLLGHEWLSWLQGRQRVRLLDAMGGAGVAGAAFALELRERGVEQVELYVLDARARALERAREFTRQALGVEAVTIQADVAEAHTYVKYVDLAIVYGNSVPHLDAYHLVRAAASLAASLKPRGTLVVDVLDLVREFGARGYRDVVVEHSEPGAVVTSYHYRYEPRRGRYLRVLVEQPTGRTTLLSVRPWDPAGVAAILWTIFRDVDIVESPVRPGSYHVVAQGPRGVNPEAFSGEPRAAGPR